MSCCYCYPEKFKQATIPELKQLVIEYTNNLDEKSLDHILSAAADRMWRCKEKDANDPNIEEFRQIGLSIGSANVKVREAKKLKKWNEKSLAEQVSEVCLRNVANFMLWVTAPPVDRDVIYVHRGVKVVYLDDDD